VKESDKKGGGICSRKNNSSSAKWLQYGTSPRDKKGEKEDREEKKQQLNRRTRRKERKKKMDSFENRGEVRTQEKKRGKTKIKEKTGLKGDVWEPGSG